MAWHRRWLGVGMTALGGWLLSGCAQLPDYALPTKSMAQTISDPAPVLPRAQMPDAVQIQRPQPLDTPPPFTPPAVRPPDPAIQQVNYTNRGTVKVRVRAWVNGQPIFDNEVMQLAGGDMARRVPSGLPERQRAQKMADIRQMAIEQLIDQEVLYQDAVKRITAGGKSHALDKLKEFVDLEFDKTLDRMRKAKVPESEIKEMEPAARRMMERNLVSTEYVRSRIKPLVEVRTGLKEVREYYEEHKNEFQSVDKVIWQDIYIPINPNQPTLEELKRFAEDLINRCRTNDDFNKLVVYDGLGKNGEGLGSLRGQIRPAELEPHLFALEPGKIGPVIPLGSGVHLIRVTKREYNGQLPLNDEVAKVIRRKLEKDIADREYKRIVRELRARAVWRIEPD